MGVSSHGFIRTPRAAARSGLGKSAYYGRTQRGLFPQFMRLGGASVVPEDELNEVLDAVRCGLSDDEIRALVRRQHAARVARAAELRAA